VVPARPTSILARLRRPFAIRLAQLSSARRRQGWILDGLTPRKAWNLVLACASYALRSKRAFHVPVVVKVDTAPACNLRCTVCVHADAHGREALEKQVLGGSQRMSVEDFRGIVAEVAGRACAVSLYYIGDPYAHPQIDELCRIARDAGLNVHLSTNFSFAFSDARIRRIVDSGVTHLTVCVDGLRQEAYERTRVGGRIDRVLSNLERVLKVRKELGRKYPKVEVQYIKFPHGASDVDEARELCARWGVDTFTEFWGALHNYSDHAPGTYDVFGPKPNGWLPLCQWPHLATLVRFDGQVIPCCEYRQAEQYRPDKDVKSLGQAFGGGLLKTWRSAGYAAARRLVSRPASAAKGLEDHFCHGCPLIFATNVNRNLRPGDYHTWEATQGEIQRAAQRAGAVTRD
jgi:MoaA/NifB/PqqE/SkfB family radical SAM enzyme